MALSIKLEVFEGPMDLLLHLLDKNKVSIYDIPIAEITDQYMEYIRSMKESMPDMEVMSDFLVMAATLLDIKSRMLLPTQKEEEEVQDPREELTARLLEYRIYKDRAKELKKMELEEGKSLYWEKERIPKELVGKQQLPDMDTLLDGITMGKLEDIFHMVMKRQIDRIDPIRSKFGEIRKEKINLADRVLSLVNFGKEKKKFSFFQLLREQEGKEGVIVTFLACLELIRRGNLQAIQNDTFADIDMEWQENGDTEWNVEDWRDYE